MSGNRFCCDIMSRQVEDGVIIYDDRFDEYNIVVKSEEGVNFLQKIDFCPWSGDRLPNSQRDRWFDELEAKGIDPMNEVIPPSFQSAEWREID